jgi:hypothetical protein
MMSVLSTLLCVLLGCVLGPTTAPSTAPDSVEMDYRSFNGLNIPYPRDWSARELSLLNGLLIVCPTTESDWQANVFVELRSEGRGKATSDLVDSRIKELKERKRNFKLSDQRVSQHPRGFECGVIDYTCDDVRRRSPDRAPGHRPLPDERRMYLRSRPLIAISRSTSRFLSRCSMRCGSSKAEQRTHHPNRSSVHGSPCMW